MASETEMVVGEVGAGGGERKRKKTLGRRKIEIKKIASMEARHVCFSKRRDGIYKKAAELCALTGAKVAVVVFSPAAKPPRDSLEPGGKSLPGGKPYSFGHPSVDAVVDRYRDDPTADSAFEAPLPPFAHEFDALRERMLEAIAAEARRKDALDAAVRAAAAAGAWTDDVVRKAEMPELVAMHAAFERVNDDVHRAMAQHRAAAAAAGACDGCYYNFGDAASFTADDYDGASSGGSHQLQQAAMDAAHMSLLMGCNGVSHATHPPPSFALAPMLLPPPDLPQPAAPVPIAFNYGSDHTHITGYEGYAYDLGLGDGGGHGAAYGTEGCYFGQTATCNFFG